MLNYTTTLLLLYFFLYSIFREIFSKGKIHVKEEAQNMEIGNCVPKENQFFLQTLHDEENCDLKSNLI